MTPSLRSFRLILHPYTRMLVTNEHVDWLNNPELMKYSEQRYFRHTLRSQLDYVSSAFRDAPTHLWLMRCDGKDIGTMSAYVDDFNKRANIGILIGNREYQRRGLAKEAMNVVMEWLFSEGIHKIELGCRADNTSMRYLAKSCKMTTEALIPDHFKSGDEYMELVLYGCFKSDMGEEWDSFRAEDESSPA